MNHMARVDQSFDLALFVGCYSKVGTRHGVMARTFSLHLFSLAFNGIHVGEIGVGTALCGHCGVPVGLVCAATAAWAEAVGQ